MSLIECIFGKAECAHEINDGFALFNPSYSHYARLHESVYNCKIQTEANISGCRLGFYNVI